MNTLVCRKWRVRQLNIKRKLGTATGICLRSNVNPEAEMMVENLWRTHMNV